MSIPTHLTHAHLLSRCRTAVGATSLLLALSLGLSAADRNWDHNGTDFNTPGNWDPDQVPGSGDRAIFGVPPETAPVMNPNLSSSTTLTGISFLGTGYTLSSSSSAIAITPTSTTTGGSSNWPNVGIYVGSNVSTTITAPITYTGTGQISVAAGGTLVLAGPITQSGTVRLRNAATGTTRLSGANTDLTGAVNLDGGIFEIGHNQAFGEATINTFVTNNTVVAYGGNRNISNTFGAVERMVTLTGANSLELSGSVSIRFSGQVSGFNNDSAGTLTLSGNVFASNNESQMTMTLGGTGAIAISGAIADRDGASTTRNNVNLNGTGGQVVTFSGNNVYTGNTAIGTGVNFTLADTGSLLFKLEDGLTNTVGGSGVAHFDGALVFDIAGVTDFDQSWNLINVGTLTESFNLADVRFKDGASFSQSGEQWTSGFWTFDETTGTLTAIPEPSMWAALLGVIALGLVILRRRKNAAA